MDAPQRPVLYTILGVLAILGGIFTGLGSLALFGLIALGGPAVLIIIVGLIVLLTAILYLVSGVGYFKMKAYMPKLVLVLLGLSVLGTILNYVQSPEGFQIGNQLFSLIVSGAIAWKVNQDKALFKN